jgi:hypothetical protein
MNKKLFALIILLVSAVSLCDAQGFIKTADLFRRPESDRRSGTLNIIQDPSVDTLISRYIMANKILEGRMEGFRIQIFRSSNRNAKEESNKERAKFMNEFPDIPSYAEFEKPGYFLVRVGDFRSKAELTKLLVTIRKKFPNAYPVPCKINFPDLIKN